MNPDRLKDLLENPDKVNSEDLSALEDVLRQFPYFQAARVLAAKAAGTSNFIKSAATYSADRKLLMKLINGSFDQDFNMPNLDDLEIQSGVNAFDHLKEESEETQEFSQLDETEEPDVHSLIDTFEKETDDEEKNDPYTFESDSTQENEESEADDFIKNQYNDSLTSDYSAEDFNLPDYNYNFGENKEEEKEDTSNDYNFTNEDNSFSDWDIDQEKEDDSKPEISDIESSYDTESNSSDAIEQNDSDSNDQFRNELMESLEDLTRIRKAAWAEEQEKLDVPEQSQPEVNEPEIEDSEETEQTFTGKWESLEEESEKEEDNSDALVNHFDTEDDLALNTDENVAMVEEFQSEKPKHVAENKRNTETITDSNLMFDDNLFELNHLIVEDEEGKVKKKQPEMVNYQHEVIDRFINTIPELTAQDHESREYSHLARDLYDRSVQADTSKMTETMAKLMVTQGKLPRAIEIYEHLMLKNPDKKAYFATQIEKVRKDI
ncbi:hypothetical protein [Chondrinema litorale]|uniref:hypothetical protein n=1 Tax=Chondrinema litorale TaxID=2994555 RepID=UPI00254274F4|nr:hypothetical protein [Chondrinema litorale]UZR94459.1 hypothetical protein OQ292_01330 [Chondrinema litorale]